jgi:DNA polymerase III alpha subunit
MKTNLCGELILEEADLFDFIMQGKDLQTLSRATVDPDIDIEALVHVLEDPQVLATWNFPADSMLSVTDYDFLQQQNWHMPQSYKQMDIAAYVLDLCKTDAELQRCGHELMMYQERQLFDLLRYLKYLVDVMTENQVIWGVGRGSSVASYVLYLLNVHKIDSIYYDLDVSEFLR